jgi:MFS family permease
MPPHLTKRRNSRMASYAEPAPAGGVWQGERRFLTLGLFLVVAGTAFDALAVSTALPVTAHELGGLAFYGWAFSAFALTDLIGVVVAGREADRYGPFMPFLVGTVLFVVGLLIAGSAPVMLVVILGRAVQGLGGGAIISVAYVVIGRGYPKDDQPQMLALLATAWVVLGLIGPGISGLVAEHLGWRWVFLGLAVFITLAGVASIPLMRRITSVSEVEPRDWRRIGLAIVLAGGVTTVQAALQQRPWLLLTLLLIGGVAITATLPRLLPKGTWRAAPGLPAVIVLTGLLNFAFFGVDSFIPLALTMVREQTVSFAGLALTASTIFWSTGAWVQARIVMRVGNRPIVWAGLISLVLGITLVLVVLQPTVSVWFILLAWGFGGLGMGLAYTTTSLTMLSTAESGHEGEASSANQLTGTLALALTTGLGGVLINMAQGSVTALRGSLAVQFTAMLFVVALAALATGNLPAITSPKLNDPDPQV